MSFFGPMLGGGGMPPSPGGAPSASAFTSPGMNPSTLAALLAMQGGVGGPGGPQLPNVQSPGAGGGPPQALGAISPAAAPGMGPGQGQGQGPTNPLAFLNDPQVRQMLMRLFGGGAGAAGGGVGMPGQGMGGPPGPGTGGSY